MNPTPHDRPRRHRTFSERRRWRRRWTGFASALLLVVLGVMSLSLRYRLVWVAGDSMLPTYRSGDLLVVDKWAYRSHGPNRGDVVVARYHGGWIVKRVVGLPSEIIEVRHGQVTVDGSRVPLEHAVELGFLDIAPGRLLADRYAILGDNRGVEPSAFLHAVVSPSQMLGKVVGAARL